MSNLFISNNGSQPNMSQTPIHVPNPHQNSFITTSKLSPIQSSSQSQKSYFENRYAGVQSAHLAVLGKTYSSSSNSTKSSIIFSAGSVPQPFLLLQFEVLSQLSWFPYLMPTLSQDYIRKVAVHCKSLPLYAHAPALALKIFLAPLLQ